MKGFADPEAANDLEKALKENNRQYTFFRYDAGHGFANQTHPENYNKECAELARKRVEEFFKEHL